MDNLAHTLLGLSLAKAGLERTTPLATATLVIASNLPDIDGIVRLGGDTAAHLRYHRGFTHSLTGLALLALGLLIIMLLVDRRRRRRSGDRVQARPFPLFLLAYLGGVCHTFMDFTNSYGVRALLPFSEQWSYGDIAFVVDPWIWLILGSTLVWVTANSRARKVYWTVLGVLTSLPVLLVHRAPGLDLEIPRMVRVLWVVGIGVTLIGALSRLGKRFEDKLPRASIVLLALYYLSMTAGHYLVLREARSFPPAPGMTSVSVWPTPANPFQWQAVTGGPDRALSWLVTLSPWSGKNPTAAGQFHGIRQLTPPDSSLVEALRSSYEGRVFLDFARYVDAVVTEEPSGYRVELRDVRFNLRLLAHIKPDRSIEWARIEWN